MTLNKAIPQKYDVYSGVHVTLNKHSKIQQKLISKDRFKMSPRLSFLIQSDGITIHFLIFHSFEVFGFITSVTSKTE